MSALAFNGRFLAARKTTGVQRVAAELLRAFDDLNFGASPREQVPSTLFVPKNANGVTPFRTIAVDKRAILPGNAWEQFELPGRLNGRLLVNLCNTAPLAHAGGVTMIHDAQAYLSPESYPFVFRAWYKGAAPIIAARSACILTVSEFSKSQLVSNGIAPAAKVRVVYNGVDHILRASADASVIRQLGLAPRSFVLALANAQKHKNIPVLFDAFASLAHTPLKLVLVGSAAAADFEAAGFVPPRNVIFASRLPDAQMRALIEHALCYAFPSLTEGFGLPPLEAMRVGCPAIIAPCGALPEVCGDAALRADPLRPGDWARAIEGLQSDPALREKYAQLGLRQAEKFNWRDSAIALRSIVRGIIANGAQPRVLPDRVE